LRHKGDKAAVRRQTGKISEIEEIIPNLPLQNAGFLVRAAQEIVEQAELVDDFESRGWIVSPRKSRRKSACFSSTSTETPARASSNPSIMPAGPPPAIQQRTAISRSGMAASIIGVAYPRPPMIAG
jgi:hypothetical protein